MLGILTGLMGLVNPVSRIVGQIADSRQKTIDAKNDAERVAAEERTKALEAQRDVLISRSGNAMDGWVRFGLALGPIVYYGKIFIWDKALALGSTDPLTPELTEAAAVIIGGFFLQAAVGRWKR